MKTLIGTTKYGVMLTALAAVTAGLSLPAQGAISISGGDDGQGNITRGNDPGECKADINWAEFTSVTADAGETVDCNPASGANGGAFPVGTNAVKCVATDAGGNVTDQKEFQVVVIDAEPPDFRVANNSRDSQFGLCGAVVNYLDQSIADNCPGVGCEGGANCPPPPFFTCDPPTGSFFPVGTTTVNCVGNDSNPANAVAKSFEVIVTDVEPPRISCPLFIPPLAPTNGCLGNVAYTMPTATDNCPDSPLVITCTPPSGTSFPPGQHVIRCNVIDSSKVVGSGGHGGPNDPPSRCTFEITVVNYFNAGNIIWHAPIADSSAPSPGSNHADIPGIYTFKVGSTIPVQIHVTDCFGAHSTSSVDGFVNIELINQLTQATITDLPEDFSGVGGSGGRMELINGHLKYNLKTSANMGYEHNTVADGTRQYRLTVTIKDKTTGVTLYSESIFLESKK